MTRSRKHSTPSPAWPHARRALWAAFFATVTWLVVDQARQIEWAQVFDAVRRIPASNLAIAAVLAATSYGVYSSFDLLGRRWTGHRLGAARVLAVTFVSYAFNLNFGALVGGLAFRYRLYARLGLENGVIARVVGLSLVTNWLGYVVLAGAVFASGSIAPPESFSIGQLPLRALGVALLAVAAAYLAACAWSTRRDFSLRGHAFTLPPLRMALAQLLRSIVNWLAVAALLYTLLQQALPFQTVLGIFLVAAIAGVVAHVPAGLGVIEAVFIALAGAEVPRNDLLGALLAYRALYYLAPLAIAIATYLVLEGRTRSGSRAGRRPGHAACTQGVARSGAGRDGGSRSREHEDCLFDGRTQ